MSDERTAIDCPCCDFSEKLVVVFQCLADEVLRPILGSDYKQVEIKRK